MYVYVFEFGVNCQFNTPNKFRKNISPTPPKLYMLRETKGRLKQKKGDGCIEREIWTECPLCIPALISRDCDCSRGHSPVIKSCWITKTISVRAAQAYLAAWWKLPPHAGLIYFNQIWTMPDKCSIPPLCSSILCVLRPLPPSLQAESSPLVSLAPHSPAWMKSHFLTLKPSRSHFSSVTSESDPKKSLGELQEVLWLSVLHDAYPKP